MTKDVLITISGLQVDMTDGEPIEVISCGQYHLKNGKHYLRYEELTEEEGHPGRLTKCTIKITDNQVDLMKKGANNVHMVFELDQNHLTYYNTVFGDIMIGITTSNIQITEEENQIKVKLKYALDMNYQFVADCDLSIIVTPKK